MEEKKIEPKFPLNTATCRDILATFSSAHELHSMDGAASLHEKLLLSCSCGVDIQVTPVDAAAVGWRFVDIKDRLSLKQLGQIGRLK